jgi:tetratricopeptide (TPR) repeat protein
MKRLFSLALLAIVTLALAGCGLSPAEEKYNSGTDKYNKGDLDGALADYNEAIRLDPNLAIAYMNRGAVYAARNEFDMAIEDSTKALELKLSKVEDQATAYTNRGAAYVGNGELDKAIADTDEAIRLKSDYAKAYYVRGVAYANQQDKEKALADLKKVLELSKDSQEGQAAQQAIDQLEQMP